jgi:hypothetical protein
MLIIRQSIALLFFLIFSTISVVAQSGVIEGSTVNKINNEPLPFVTLLVVGTDFGVVSDIDGNYKIEGLKPGLYDIRASFVGFEDLTSFEVQVTNSKPTILNFEMTERSTALDEVVVKASPFVKTEESPVSLRSIGVAEIQRNPGGNRDISKVVQSLPGVTSTANFRNDLIIRGGSPNENRFYLDDVEVPNINHFATQGASGGPVGLINVNFIREVDFYSGAFPANRGNTLSSVFNFKQKDGRSDKLGLSFTAGASDVGLTLEGPIGEKTTFLFSARRSYLQFLFAALELPFLPTYNDFQAKVKTKINQRNEITFIGLGAIDEFSLNLDANETEDQQYLLNNLPVSPQWNYTNGLVYKHYRDKGYWTVVFSRNMLNNESKKYFENDDSDENNLILDYKSQESENKFRLENTTRINGWKINTGVGYEGVRYTNNSFVKIATPVGPEDVFFNSKLYFNKYSVFTQFSKKLLDDKLALSFGARMDGNNYADNMSNMLEQFSPRLSLAYNLNANLAINANVGRYFQLPPYTVLGYRENNTLFNRDVVDYIQADHAVLGLEYITASSSKITLEGYYKKYSNYPYLIDDNITLANLGGDFGVIGNDRISSTANGEAYGLEFLFQQRLYKGFYGIGSYTLGWSKFDDEAGELVSSSWDSRHIVNLTLGKKFGKDWELGVNWRFQTGLPYTPFSDLSNLVLYWDINNAGIRDYSQLNTARAAASNTIDLRIDKKWFFDNFTLNLYFDIENIFGNAVGSPVMLLDRELDADGLPVGPAVIENPTDPIGAQRYKVKLQDVTQGTPIPSLGVLFEI